jgi:hypothetical protein
LDFYRLAVPFANALNPEGPLHALQSGESYKAFQILERKAKREGPGWIFLDYVSVPLDQTLQVATRPFNALYHPSPKPFLPSWMAFLCNINYLPFLEKKFPGAEWFTVGSSLMPWDGELMLGVVPVTSQSQAAAERYLKADPLFHGMTREMLKLSEEKSREGPLAVFLNGYGLVQGDPFLESSFWEIAYFNHSADRKFQDSLNDLQMILKEGYPAAHVYNELGGLLYFEKDRQGAKQAFIKAVQLGGSHTPAQENLRWLETGLK